MHVCMFVCMYVIFLGVLPVKGMVVVYNHRVMEGTFWPDGCPRGRMADGESIIDSAHPSGCVNMLCTVHGNLPSPEM